MKGRYIALLLIVGLTISLLSPMDVLGEVQDEENQETNIIKDEIKDETVYVSLNSEGGLKEINVVNRIETSGDGTYVDYGEYEDIAALSKPAKHKVKGDSIHWELKNDPKGFYYQGKLKKGEIPYTLKIEYYLNGLKISADDLAGKDGKINIKIEAKPNNDADPDLKDRYYYQLQTELSLDNCSNIKAPRATSIISGRTHNLGFMLMPGKEDVFGLEFDAKDFSFSGFTMTSMDIDIEGMVDLDTDSIKDGFDEMNKASDKLAEGTGELKSGMEKLAKATSKLSKGAADTKEGLKKYRGGVSEYKGGLSELTKNAQVIDEKLRELSRGGQALMDGFKSLKAGIGETFMMINPEMLPPELAQQLGGLSHGIDEHLSQYENELNKYIGGVTALSNGMSEFTKGMSQLESSGGELLPGLDSIINGMGQLTEGLSKTAAGIQDIPKDIEKLIDGQEKLGDGLKEASEGVEDLKIGEKNHNEVKSFVSDKNKPRSLQFIYRTEEIGIKEQNNSYKEPKEIKKSFWERFLDLFR